MRTPTLRGNKAEVSTVAERPRRRASNTCRGGGGGGLYKGRTIEDSHTGEWIYRGRLEVRAKVPPGATDGAKERGSETERGKERASVHPPLAPGSVGPQGAAVCSHAETLTLLSPPLLPTRGRPIPGPNLQHMRQSFASPLPSSPPTPPTLPPTAP